MSPVTRHRWVTFDCYGTLVDWQAGFAAILAGVAGDRAPQLARAYDEHERIVERDRPHRSFKDVVVTALRRAAEEIGLDVPESAARGVLARWDRLRPFDDTEPLLAALRRQGYRLAVLTNCDDDLFQVTHRTFAAPFDLFVTAERVRGYKPAPWHFRAFEMLTRARRSEWVHVAASRYHDIEPAASLGVRHVWLDRTAAPVPSSAAAVRVTSAGDVAAAVNRLLGDRRHGIARSNPHGVDAPTAIAQTC